MTAKSFADTNIVIYAEASDVGKAQRATAILEPGPISSQVVTETISALTRKYGFTLTEAHEVALSLMDLCEVVPVGADTIREAVRLAARYQLSHWDSLIVAAATLAGCETPYSQDLQHNQLFDDWLRIINPFAG
ncbi:MAG: PIN domain-containing protein [Steroidobacteraceae bacterium]|nr:PIN domain-containing protein [Steroidobacteraceae bacterium]